MAINTLVTIKDSITAFADGHGQLQGRVIFEADDHRSAYITVENTYPLLFVAPIDVQPTRAMNIHTLRVYVYERINDDRLDVWENANDTSLILRDIRVWWNDYGVDEINIVEDPIGQFGCDKELDNLVGYFADIRFEIPSHGRCQVPVDVKPIPSTSCADAIQIIEDTLGNRLYTNDIPSGATETQIIQDSFVNLKDTNSNIISTTFIPAQGSAGIIAPDALLHIKKENDGTITNLTLLSNSSTQYIVDNNDISVNGILEFDIHATEPLDIRLRDTSNSVITPISVTDSGNHATIVLPSAPSPRSTATLMKTGQTVSYALEDDAATLSQGRATDFVTLDTAPLHNNGSATLNTTTNRFTDSLGGQTYTDKVVLDWSTWNGSTLLGYRISLSTTNQNWEDARVQCIALSFGGFSDWRVTNDNELNNICKRGGYVTTVLNYAPFSITADLNIWTSTTYPINTLNAYFLGSTGNASLSNLSKTVAACRYIPVRTFSLSTSNVLS
jgi:hypothetical protein